MNFSTSSHHHRHHSASFRRLVRFRPFCPKSSFSYSVLLLRPMLCAAVARGVSSQVQALKRFRAPASGSPFVAEDVADKDFMLC